MLAFRSGLLARLLQALRWLGIRPGEPVQPPVAAVPVEPAGADIPVQPSTPPEPIAGEAAAVARFLQCVPQTDFRLPARLAGVSSLNTRAGRQPRRTISRDVNAKPVPIAKRGARKGPRAVTGPLFARSAPAIAPKAATVLHLPMRPKAAGPGAAALRRAA
ncbi:MAG: hypothetical protein KJZ80_14160 [Hyphomicrobiaceae bacterium]|nr:hypothetical protein [Hyphomicrobiaceae bacterium]